MTLEEPTGAITSDLCGQGCLDYHVDREGVRAIILDALNRKFGRNG